jgi:hypothetical protein
VIREATAKQQQQGDDDLVALALSLFSSAFSALERAGKIVRDFPASRDTNIWVFGYLLDAVETASTAPVFEKRCFDHTRMLTELASVLEWQHHAAAAGIVRERLATATFPKAGVYNAEAIFRLGHMRRFLNFSMGLALEMEAKGLWPAHDSLDAYRDTFEAATLPGSTPSYLLDVRDLIDDIAREVEPISARAAEAVLRFRSWKPRTY